jgi:ADP-ribosyl-[dinitrogen reductase] hydrolase
MPKQTKPRNKVTRPRRTQFIGCLLGGALGDALGYPIEFAPLAKIPKQQGAGVPKSLPLNADSQAVVSDDTQMTLFMAEGMIRARQRMRDRGICSVPHVIRGALLRWLSTQTEGTGARATKAQWPGWLVGEPKLHVQRAPGTTCLSALKKIGTDDMIPTTERPINDSKGCGAVMRSAPAGLAASDRREAFELGRDTGALTHGHPSGYLAAAYLASLVFDLVRRVPLDEAMRNADSMVRAERGHEELMDVVSVARRAARAGPPTPKAVESLGSGWVGEEALAIALLCALTADTRTPAGFAGALWRAVRHSGDSDSTGSITGNLLGAIVGVNGLPPHWVAQIELRPVIERLGKDLYAVAVDGVELDHTAYPPN